MKKGVRYLWIKISDNPSDMVIDNIVSFKNKLMNMLWSWQKLGISWWGRLAVIKMKILLVLLFLFQNLIIHVQLKYVNEIQGLLNGFL